MTSRPSVKPKTARPNSAVYIGSDPGLQHLSSTPPTLPDLPEPPPSPGAESNSSSGLPSPPATNSTGSGSTGDPASIAIRNNTMLTNSNVKAFHAAFSQHDDDDDNDYDEDNTARLDRRHSLNENIQALERVKSLTQRNRQALDKLSSFSRLSSPSPNPRTTTTTRNPRHSFTSDHLSGSETEREPPQPSASSSHSGSSSSNRPTTPTRMRLVSAPESPGKALRNTATRKRISMVSEPDADITHAALAAVASSRRSPTARKRQPLPREFREGSSSSTSSGASVSRRGSIEGRYSTELSPRSTTLQLSPRTSIRNSLSSKSSTVRHSMDLPAGNRADTGRRQSLRGGSAESALTVGPPGTRSLVGEGLRAAGINRRSRDLTLDNIFDSPVNERSGSRLGVDPGRSRKGTITQRSHTSMEEERAPLRTYKSAYPLGGERAPSSLSRQNNSPLPERYSSPYGTRRVTTTNTGGESEHTRLMHESLSMFEANLSRFSPHLLSSSSANSPKGNELLRTAESLVNTAEKLNILLKQSTNRALEEQIDAEVNSPTDSGSSADVWRRIGGEYRESLRVSDEVVRSVTGLLIGVGRAIRELTLSSSGGEHARSVSLDEGSLNGEYNSPNIGGRRSVADRRSWEPPSGGGGRESAVGIRSRPSSVLRERERDPDETPPSNTKKPALTNGSIRRVTNSQDAYEPSPTPASCTSKRTEPPASGSSRALPPLSIPRPLPTLPSETPSRPRRSSITDNNKGTTRRKTSISTIRGTGGSGSNPPMMTTPTTTTTALTPHTVSNEGARLAFPSKSPAPGRSNTVTFSKSSTVTALQQLRNRTISASEEHPVPVPVPVPILSKQLSSGSETERPRVGLGLERSVRISFDGAAAAAHKDREAHPADRSAASVLGTRSGGTRERRRTVVDIWPPK